MNTSRINELLSIFSITRDSIFHTQNDTAFDRKITLADLIKNIASLITLADYQGSGLESLVLSGTSVYDITTQEAFEYYFGDSSLPVGGFTDAGWGTIDHGDSTPRIQIPADVTLRFSPGTYICYNHLSFGENTALTGNNEKTTTFEMFTGKDIVIYPTGVLGITILEASGNTLSAGLSQYLSSDNVTRVGMDVTAGNDSTVLGAFAVGGDDTTVVGANASATGGAAGAIGSGVVTSVPNELKLGGCLAPTLGIKHAILVEGVGDWTWEQIKEDWSSVLNVGESMGVYFQYRTTSSSLTTRKILAVKRISTDTFRMYGDSVAAVEGTVLWVTALPKNVDPSTTGTIYHIYTYARY